jgi:hypothetical protein
LVAMPHRGCSVLAAAEGRLTFGLLMPFNLLRRMMCDSVRRSPAGRESRPNGATTRPTSAARVGPCS